MSVSRSNISKALTTLSSYAILRVILFFGWFIPGLSHWAKRMLFMLCVCHELERIRVLTHVPLKTLNSKLFKIQTPIVLTNVSEWSQSFSFELDLMKLKSKGVDIDKITTGAKFTPCELETITRELVGCALKKFDYGKRAMFNDIQRILQEKEYIRITT